MVNLVGVVNVDSDGDSGGEEGGMNEGGEVCEDIPWLGSFLGSAMIHRIWLCQLC